MACWNRRRFSLRSQSLPLRATLQLKNCSRTGISSLVNSAAHKSGYRTYDSRDEYRNCWWVALLSFGEGGHNNHHAFPRSVRHGLRWWEFDSNYLVVAVMQGLGLAWDVRDHEHLRQARARSIADATV